MNRCKLWIWCLLLPAGLLAASVIQRPGLFEATVISKDVLAQETAPIPLYETADRTFYFTTLDLLHPEAFGSDGPKIDVVAVDIVPTTELPDKQTHLPTWFLQIGRLLKLKAADGAPLSDLEPNSQDLQLQRDFTEFVLSSPKMKRGDIHVLTISDRSTIHALTGLSAVIFLAVAQPPGDGLSQPHLGLSAALELAATKISELDLRGLGIPCIGSLTGPPSCDHSDWQLVLEAVDELSESTISTVVLGGWAKTVDNRIEKARRFADVWRDWQRNVLTPRTEKPNHEALRLATVALAGSLIGSAWRSLTFSWVRLFSLFVLSGGMVGVAAKLAADFLPLWTSALSPQTDFGIKLVAAFLLGLFIDAVIGFDPKKSLQSAARKRE